MQFRLLNLMRGKLYKKDWHRQRDQSGEQFDRSLANQRVFNNMQLDQSRKQFEESFDHQVRTAEAQRRQFEEQQREQQRQLEIQHGHMNRQESRQLSK